MNELLFQHTTTTRVKLSVLCLISRSSFCSGQCKKYSLSRISGSIALATRIFFKAVQGKKNKTWFG